MDEIKKRDRWTCKMCGHRYTNLVVVKYAIDKYITLCEECDWLFDGYVHHLESEHTKWVNIFDALLLETKIVLVGDCHGDFSSLDAVLEKENPDMFISVGDVGTLEDVTHDNLPIIDKWKGIGYYVRGNHDKIQFFNSLGGEKIIRGLKIVGLNGFIKTRTFTRDIQDNISFREIMYLSHLKNVDILVTHQSPTGLFRGKGEPILEELINYLVPRIYICGHIHKYRLKFYLNTFCISLPLIKNGYVVSYWRGRQLVNLEAVLKKGKKVIRI